MMIFEIRVKAEVAKIKIADRVNKPIRYVIAARVPAFLLPLIELN